VFSSEIHIFLPKIHFALAFAKLLCYNRPIKIEQSPMKLSELKKTEGGGNSGESR